MNDNPYYYNYDYNVEADEFDNTDDINDDVDNNDEIESEDELIEDGPVTLPSLNWEEDWGFNDPITRKELSYAAGMIAAINNDYLKKEIKNSYLKERNDITEENTISCADYKHNANKQIKKSPFAVYVENSLANKSAEENEQIFINNLYEELDKIYKDLFNVNIDALYDHIKNKHFVKIRHKEKTMKRFNFWKKLAEIAIKNNFVSGLRAISYLKIQENIDFEEALS